MGAQRTEAEQKVLRTFVVNERLTRLPARWKKRMVIYRWMVDQLDTKRRYPEQELNDFLRRFHPDVATIRREFIVYGLMSRERGMYWRIDAPTD